MRQHSVTTSQSGSPRMRPLRERESIESIYALLRRRLGRRFGSQLDRLLDPDDVVQDVLIAALEDLDEKDFENPGRLSSWFRRVAERKVVDAIRRQHTLRRGDGLDVREDGDGPAGIHREFDRVDDLDENGRAFASLRGMRPDHREVILLRDFFGLPWQQVAALLNRETEGAVHQLHRRARANLLKALGDPVQGSAPSSHGPTRKIPRSA